MIQQYIPEIITFIAGAVAWFLERNKRQTDKKNSDLQLEKLKSELDRAKTDNDQSIVSLYQDALNDLKKRYDSDIKELEEKFDKKLEEMDARYARLKKAFEDYKKKHP